MMGMKKLIENLLAVMLVIGITAGGIVTYNGYRLYKQVTTAVPVSEKVVAIEEQEHYTTYDELPKRYIEAVIAAEDRRFFQHRGFDILATSRAMWHNIEARRLIEGGSTITQQLAKNMYFTQEKKFTRKVAEVFVAHDLEELCDKKTLFELYVNSIYFGSGYYNIYDAAHGYYDKDPIDMNDYECTMLAGIPNAPSVYAPTVNPKLAEERRQQVLTCMVENGYIKEGELSQPPDDRDDRKESEG